MVFAITRKKIQMKKRLLLTIALGVTTLSFAQNIDDNKINFSYIQLPKQKISDQLQKYELRINHNYEKANEDSLRIAQQRADQAIAQYKSAYKVYATTRDQMEKDYLNKMIAYDKSVAAGQTATLPDVPVYPQAPILQLVDETRLNSAISDEIIGTAVTIDGFEKGLGGCILTIDIDPIQNFAISVKEVSKKWKAEYTYRMPIHVTFESPTSGKVFEKVYLDNVTTDRIKDFNSYHEYRLWEIDNKDTYYKEAEQRARNQVFTAIRAELNNEFGYPVVARRAEIYDVKKYKSYDYTDVTTAYTATTQALMLVKNDRDRSGAMTKINGAINMWNAILSESNLVDDKSRINDKVTAMIYCNLAELYMWKGDFDNAELQLNQAENAGVLKFKNHAKDEHGILNDQRARWQVHY